MNIDGDLEDIGRTCHTTSVHACCFEEGRDKNQLVDTSDLAENRDHFSPVPTHPRLFHTEGTVVHLRFSSYLGEGTWSLKLVKSARSRVIM
jgi:hypothetical protein